MSTAQCARDIVTQAICCLRIPVRGCFTPAIRVRNAVLYGLTRSPCVALWRGPVARGACNVVNWADTTWVLESDARGDEHSVYRECPRLPSPVGSTVIMEMDCPGEAGEIAAMIRMKCDRKARCR